MTNKLNLKLCDFDMSKQNDEYQTIVTSADSLCTLRWKCPESFEQNSVWNTACDMYSVGMTLYEIETRDIPFKSAANEAIKNMVVNKNERPDFPKVSANGDEEAKKFREMIEGCWHRQPEKRFTSKKLLDFIKLNYKE